MLQLLNPDRKKSTNCNGAVGTRLSGGEPPYYRRFGILQMPKINQGTVGQQKLRHIAGFLWVLLLPPKRAVTTKETLRSTTTSENPAVSM